MSEFDKMVMQPVKVEKELIEILPDELKKFFTLGNFICVGLYPYGSFIVSHNCAEYSTFEEALKACEIHNNFNFTREEIERKTSKFFENY